MFILGGDLWSLFGLRVRGVASEDGVSFRKSTAAIARLRSLIPGAGAV